MLQEIKIVLCSISWQIFHRDADRISVVSGGNHWQHWRFNSSVMLGFNISLYTKFPLTQLEIIAAT